MALNAHNSVKLGVRPSFWRMRANSSAVNRRLSAVFSLISIFVVEAESGPKLSGFDKYSNVGPSAKKPPASFGQKYDDCPSHPNLSRSMALAPKFPPRTAHRPQNFSVGL